MELPQHRKRILHFNEPGHIHFLTFSCFNRLPLLTNDLFRTKLSRQLDTALDTHKFELSGFVFMPEHVHLLVWPREEQYSMDAFLQSLKRPFSSAMKKHFESIQSPILKKLTVQERPGKMVFRFWQEGPGYDRNVWSEKYIRETLDYIHNNPVKRRLVPSPDRWNWSSWKAYDQPDQPVDASLPTVRVLKF